MRFPRLSLSFAVAALVVACDSSSTEPHVDLDAALSQMATSGIGTYATAAAGAGVNLPSPSTSASSCPYDAATKFFVCAPITASGMTFSRQFQLLDAAGAPLATVNPLAVASLVQKMVPKVLWENDVTDPADPTWVITPISWSIDPADWEAARQRLADIIEGG